MNDAITPKTVQNIFKAFASSSKMPSLETLAFLEGETSYEREQYLRQLLNQIITRNLLQRRQYLKVLVPDAPTPTQDTHKRALIADAQAGDPMLLVWSYMYHRFVVDTGLQAKQMYYLVNDVKHNYERRLSRGYKELAEHLTKLNEEAQRRQRLAHLHHYIGAAEYRDYVGMEAIQAKLVKALLKPDGPRWLSLEGIGGIGKTALARRIVEQVSMDSGLRSVWLSARQQRFDNQTGCTTILNTAQTTDDLIDQLWHCLNQPPHPTLSQAHKLLKLATLCTQTPYLIVIDNLETIAESECLPLLYPLAGQTRFLITSRETLRRFDFVTAATMPELPDTDAQGLLMMEYQRLNEHALELGYSEWQAIHKTVGGIPLALKLIAAQLGPLTLEECLTGLQDFRQQQRSEEMFTYIYQRTWQLLSSTARNLLLGVHDTIPQEGISPAWLKHMAAPLAITSKAYESAFEELRYYMLLEILPGSRHCILHRLTTTFLQNTFHGRGSEP